MPDIPSLNFYAWRSLPDKYFDECFEAYGEWIDDNGQPNFRIVRMSIFDETCYAIGITGGFISEVMED